MTRRPGTGQRRTRRPPAGQRRTRRTLAGRMPMVWLVVAALAITASACTSAQTAGPPTPEPALSDALAFRGDDDLDIRIVAPGDRAVVTSPFEVEIELDGIRPAPSGYSQDGEGHWHLVIGEPCVDPGTLIHEAESMIHVGNGSLDAEVTLGPGVYTICAQVGDGFHVGINVTDTIVVTVVD